MLPRLQLGDRLFAVKEHLSSSLHWDLRLQFSGQTVLSFALHVPPRLDPGRPIRATRVEAHQLKYMFKEWIIPFPMPGAGPTALWDSGFFQVLGEENMCSQLNNGRLKTVLVGKRLNGNFSLKWIGPRESDWLWVKEWDNHADPLRSFPNVLTPEKVSDLEGRRPVSQNQELWTSLTVS